MYIKTNEFSIFILSLQKYSIGCSIMIYEKTTMKADDLIFNNQCEKYVYNENQLLGEMTNLILSIFRVKVYTTINLADQLHNLVTFVIISYY
jgi:hypothetical protein